MEKGYYNVSEQELIGQPESKAAYTAEFNVTISGQQVPFHTDRFNISLLTLLKENCMSHWL